MHTSRQFDAFFVILLVGLLVAAAIYRRELSDELALRFYRAPAEVSMLATQAGFSDAGRRLFYLSRPVLADKATIETNCSAGTLGCTTTHGIIYILKAGDGESASDEIVTAAHEMLHQAYRHLSDQAKRSVDDLSGVALGQLTDSDITQRLTAYADPSERADERHSILGSEAPILTPQLETYYAAYFADRTKTTAAQSRSQDHPL